MKRWIKGLLALFLVGVIAYGIFSFVWGVPSVDSLPTPTDTKTIDAGKYLTAAGDCVSCHTADNGVAFAGGRLLETPFGGLYSTNLTPSADGLKGKTSAEFYQIMAYGADSVWDPVYPAMPYPSFHLVTRDDSDAIFAYLMSLPPVDAKVPANTMPFPFNIRQSLFAWNLLFAERGVFQPDPDKDAVWNRGAYLVEGLGHCGGCHTPRNFLGAAKQDRALTGTQIGMFEAPDITAGALKKRGWNQEHLVTYFETGASPEGTAFGEMFLAVKNSLRHLTHDDRVAVATYLMNGAVDDPSYGETVVAGLGSKAHPNKVGQALYLSNCSLCHGSAGQGIAGTMPALKGSSTIAQADAVNLISVIANGLKPEEMSSGIGYGPMPAFHDRLSAAQIADLVNYLRDEFVGEAGDLPEIDAAHVGKLLALTKSN